MKPKKKLPESPDEAIKEARRFYRNAKDILKTAPVRNGVYQDTKPVREASAMGYLSCLFAIGSYLLSKGTKPNELPTKVEEYMKALKKVPHNGKLIDSYIVVYQNLHILGYYRGGVGVGMIKEGFKHAKLIIDTLARQTYNRYICKTLWR